MHRRQLLASGVMTGAALAGLVGIGAGRRWHSAPRRQPYLTAAYLAGLKTRTLGQRPHVLFIGNSNTVRHNVPELVAQAAATDHVWLEVAMAAANGARLVETAQIPELEPVLTRGWDVLVLQDFSTTCLRAIDRLGALWAMRRLVRLARPETVLLYPNWAFPLRHRIYREGGARFSKIPDNPTDFAARIIDFYGSVAQKEGWHRVPVTETLFPDMQPYLAPDNHHLNAKGAEQVAQLIWQTLQAAQAQKT